MYYIYLHQLLDATNLVYRWGDSLLVVQVHTVTPDQVRSRLGLTDNLIALFGKSPVQVNRPLFNQMSLITESVTILGASGPVDQVRASRAQF